MVRAGGAVTRLLDERGAEVWHCDWRGLLERARELGGVDSLIVDAPYSERCHAGHDEQASHIPSEDGIRRRLQYACWGQQEVDAFVDAWGTLVRNWFVSLTDSDLAPLWRAAFDRVGLLSFARIPSIESGATVRFNGDGPPNWTVDVMVARTRGPRHQGAWRPAPYYLHPREQKPVVGGKPLSLMRALVRDYTRPGDLVCDPCGGAMTTGLACVMEGRRFLGGDAMREHAEMGAERLRAAPGETKAGQLALLG